MFIHSVMSENDKKVLLIILGFPTKYGMWDILRDFQKRRFQGFISESLRMVSPLGGKFIFLKLP